MAQPDYVPITSEDRVRPIDQLPVQDHWLPNRPGDLHSVDLPQGKLFGNVGPCGPVPPNTYKQCVLVQASVGWEAMLLGCVLVGGLVLLYVFWRKFFSLSGDFAEEL